MWPISLTQRIAHSEDCPLRLCLYTAISKINDGPLTKLLHAVYTTDKIKVVLQKPYRSKDTDSMYTAYYLMNIHAGQ